MKVIVIVRGDDFSLEYICSSKEKCLEHMENKLKYYKTGGDMSIEVDFSGISVHPSWYLEKVDFHFYEFEVNKTTIVDIAPIIIPSLLKVLEKNDWDYIDHRNPRAIINGREVPLSQKYPQ